MPGGGAARCGAGGRRSGAPALEPGAALGKRAVAASAGGLTFSVAGFACRSSAFLPPSPLPPSRREGGIFSFFMQGASPLASPGAGRSAALARLALAVPRGERALLVAGSPCRYDAQRGGLPSLPPADAAFSFCFCPLPRGRISGGLIRQAHEKCRLIKIPRGGHTDATAQRGDSRLSCRQCLPRRNRNRVRKQKKHRRNRGN